MMTYHSSTLHQTKLHKDNMKINIDDLNTALETNDVVVKFKTKKGLERAMLCTRDLSVIPDNQHDGINDPVLNGDSIVAVYDYDNSAWRAFRKDAVTSYEIDVYDVSTPV